MEKQATSQSIMITMTIIAIGSLVAPAGFIGFVFGAEQAQTPATENGNLPHVIVGITDHGLNPYHDHYQRPDLTDPPCTYLEDFPCDVERLDLSLEMDDYDAAFAADAETWETLRLGQWYWIPGTSVVAFYCQYRTSCGPGGSTHGIGTSSSMLTENPEALLAFKAGSSQLREFRNSGIPVDIYSVSIGLARPAPLPAGTCETAFAFTQTAPLYVKSAGNDPRSVLMDCWAGHPNTIAVGGAYAADNREKSTAAKQADVVSYYCRSMAAPETITGLRDWCGTSFAAPTVAGALSRVILEVRKESGYTGSLQDGYIDPIAGVTTADLRDAMNRTASYDPKPRYPHSGDPIQDPQRNDAAPWVQWGWGFYDTWVANATIDHLLETAQPEKPLEARIYMEGLYAARSALYEERV